MTVLQDKLDLIKSKQLQARKDRDKSKTSLWSCVLGDFETQAKKRAGDPTIEDLYGVIRSTINGIESMRQHVGDTPELRSDEEDLRSILPKQMTSIELDEFFAQCKAMGMNMGASMKLLKETRPSAYDGKQASEIAKEVWK